MGEVGGGKVENHNHPIRQTKTVQEIMQEISMHSVSTGQCERVYFPGGHFADPVILRLTLRPTNMHKNITRTPKLYY